MKTTLFERTLQETLKNLGMPLGDRVSGEDLEFEADLEDLTSQIDSSVPFSENIERMINDRVDLSRAQMFRGSQSLFLRDSSLYQGLGFGYTIEPTKYSKKSMPLKPVDQVVLERDFDSECFLVYYNQDASWKLEGLKPRFQSQLVRTFYENGENLKLLLCILPSGKIVNVENYSRIEEGYEGSQRLREGLEKIETFEGEILDETQVKLFMDCLRRMKEGL